jgi:hypothetical protein
VCPAVRLSDNSSQLYSIELKFCAQNCLINVSREKKKMRKIRQEMAELSKKLSLLTRPSLRGGTGFFFQKKYFSQNYLKYIWIDSVFNADSEYDISFEPNRRFWTKSCFKKVSNAQKLYPETSVSRYVSGAGVLGFF